MPAETPKKKTPLPESAAPASDSQLRAAVAKAVADKKKSPAPGTVAPVDRKRIKEIMEELAAEEASPRVASEEATAKTWIVGELFTLLTANKWLVGGVIAFLLGLYAHLETFSGLPGRLAAAEAKIDQLLKQQETLKPPTSTPHGGP